MHRLLAGVALSLVALSCDGPLNSEDAGWVLASLRGVVEEQYQGTGEFHLARPPGFEPYFWINSDGVGSSIGRSFGVVVFGGEMLHVGRYPIREPSKVYGESSGATAFYDRPDGQWQEWYAAVSGDLEITHSSRNRLEGRFRLKAVRYCRNPPLTGPDGPFPEGSCHVLYLDLSAPSVELTGSFVAVPWQQKEIIPVPG